MEVVERRVCLLRPSVWSADYVKSMMFCSDTVILILIVINVHCPFCLFESLIMGILSGINLLLVLVLLYQVILIVCVYKLLWVSWCFASNCCHIPAFRWRINIWSYGNKLMTSVTVSGKKFPAQSLPISIN